MSERLAVLVVGVGGIGHPCALALGQNPRVALTLLDDDLVERSNLHRLIAFGEQDLGQRKTAALARAIEQRYQTSVRCINDRLGPENAVDCVKQYALVIEGTDNFASKFLVADACFLGGVPVVHGAAVGWTGTVFTTLPGVSSCYRCVFEDVPQGDTLDCSTAGVFGPVTSVIGALMASEAARVLQKDPNVGGSLLSFHGQTAKVRRSSFARRSDCPLCGAQASIHATHGDRYLPAQC